MPSITSRKRPIVGLDAQLQYAADEVARLAQKAEQLAASAVRPRRSATRSTAGRMKRAASIVRLQARAAAGRRSADGWRSAACSEAREAADDLNRRAAEAAPAHAAMVERAARWLPTSGGLRKRRPNSELRASCARSRARVDARRSRGLARGESSPARPSSMPTSARLMGCRTDVQHADDIVSALRVSDRRTRGSSKDARVCSNRFAHVVAELDIARATAESDLAHLATSCLDTVQATLDDVGASKWRRAGARRRARCPTRA